MIFRYGATLALLLCLCAIPFGAFCQEQETDPAESSAVETQDEAPKKPYIVFNEGLAAGFVTRIVKQEHRSNFVFNDMMAGAFFGIKTVDMRPLDYLFRVAAYYPLSFKFNKVPQLPKNVIRYAADVFAGVNFDPGWDFVRFNISPGIHFLFQNADRWNYIHLGAGLFLGAELPLSTRWTILAGGMASLDYGNLGANRYVEPYDIVYQYQIDFGVRYSKKNGNKFSYLGAISKR
jgi:hypothetical protein